MKGVLRCAEPVDPPLSDGVVGLYFSAISIIIVYHLFALQSWLAAVDAEQRVAADVERRTVVGDVERDDVLDEIAELRSGFPIIHVTSLGFAVAALSALAIAASVEADLPFLYGGTPTIVMLVVFAGSTAACRTRGRRKLDQMRDLLVPGSPPPTRPT